MKKVACFFILLLPFFSGFCQKVVKTKDGTNSISILKNDISCFSFKIQISEFNAQDFSSNNQNFTKISINDFYPNNDLSNPELPALSKLIEIPNNSEAEISVIGFSEQVIDLQNYGFEFPIYPNQVSVSKDKDPNSTPLLFNKNIYFDKNFYSPKIAELENLGKFRGTNISQIVINPFSYDIETNTLYLKNELTIEIKFKTSDNSTKSIFSNHSKEFSPIYKYLWNYQNQVKSITINQTPIKYLIISDRIFEADIQPFIQWKSKEGYNIICEYTDIIGNTKEEIKSYIEDLYSSATEENPAPSYLLFIGDVEQIPTYTTNNHASDLYYCTFDGEDDFIPDMYYGRLSAQNSSQLIPQINKIISYEQCNFTNNNFLQNVTLVAGYDNTFGPINANGQMNYARNYYFNEEHNINTTSFLYPTSINFIPEIKTSLSNGNSFVNYTGHCVASRWQNVNIDSTAVNSLTNSDKPFFTLANCCLSSKYNVSECVGETFMRAVNKGAATYIGASDNTYWNEDYYWSVGLTNSIIANPTYSGTQAGIYDHLFHENLEEPIKNAGEIIFCGNMSVMTSTSTYKKIYWEIYNVLGDPSLMPYAGIPDNLQTNYFSAIPEGINFINISAETNSYVAISKNNVLISAKYSDENGFAHFDIDPQISGTLIDVVITKQFKIPHIGQISVIPNNANFDIAISQIHNPTNIYYENPSSIIPEIEIVNLGNSPITNAIISYTINNNSPIIYNWSGILNTFQMVTITFPEIFLPSDEYSFSFEAITANDENVNNNSLQKNIIIYAGNVLFQKIISPKNVNCDVSEIIPEILIKNVGNNILTSLKCNYSSGAFSDEKIWTGNLFPNDSINISFPTLPLTTGNYEILFEISEPNGGLNENHITSKTENFSVNNIGNSLTIKLLTDDFPHEVSFLLQNLNTGDTIFSDGNFSGSSQILKNYDLCLIDGCYKFIIKDSYSDGMNYPPSVMGNVLLININDTILTLNGNEYTNSFEKYFCLNFDGIICPQDIVIEATNTQICLYGGYPEGGIYSGEGIDNGCFLPSNLGIGTHIATYTITTDTSELSCNFTIVVSPLSLIDITNNNFEIYPNPTSNYVKIKTNSNQIFDIEVINTLGEKILYANNFKDKAIINLSDFKNGIYFVKITTEDNCYYEKIVIQK
ncbi:MAG: C25 family cysteine peptidase [Bacteroidales bacterium]|jgi:hypothetical protein|nr:C25 family cysteine peptidase [Bacteroidales bacterium]